MKTFKEVLPKAAVFFLILSVVCGILYTAAITGAAQALFSDKANGSIIEIDGKKYGSHLLGQQYTDETHMWGRIMNIDTSTYTDKDGNAVMYAGPANINPASSEYAETVSARVDKIKAAHPEKGEQPIPVDLVTCSGSGLDPNISVAAAQYQAERVALENGISEDEVNKIIDKYTTGRFLGIFGEPVVNVLEVNLALDGILVD